jgi:hypothetical protein
MLSLMNDVKLVFENDNLGWNKLDLQLDIFFWMFLVIEYVYYRGIINQVKLQIYHLTYIFSF